MDEKNVPRLSSTVMFPIIETYLESEKTQRAFCEHQDLNPSVFQYWLKKYREQSLGPTGEENKAFVPLTISGPTTTAIEIRLPNGIQILIPAQ